MTRAPAVLAAAALLAACASEPALPEAPVAAGAGVAVKAEPVALNPADPAQDSVGMFRYAGGLVLSSDATARLHGLSDLLVEGDRFTSVSDEGDLVTGRLALDARGRLSGVTGVEIAPLAGLDGQPIQGKADADAEGLARLANGDLLVSFERNHRIWRYPAGGGAPVAAPSPQGVAFPDNGGLEALAAAPDVGPDAYVAGGEESGQTWTCRLSAACVPGPVAGKPADFGLVAITRLPDGRWSWVLRAWDPARGNRIALVVAGADGRETARLELARPYTVDNIEGVAAVPSPGGAGVRFYLLSDDNFQASQRTLLMAFDWTP